MTTGPDTGKYDPFEDTGDWPFRDAPPKPEPEFVASEPLAAESFAAEAAEVSEEPALAGPAGDEAAAEDVEEDVVGTPEGVVAEDTDEAVVVDEAGVIEDAPEETDDAPEETQAEESDVPVTSAESEAHAPGTLVLPPGTDILSGEPHGFRRSVAVVVSRFNGDITTGLLESALAALRECNVADEAVTVVPVPGAFELPLTALALAKTRRFSCVVALGCVIRGDTAHFDLVAGEAASGLQLAGIETGIPVSFGVIACETREQAEARFDRGAEAARTALEMADLFSHVRTRAAAG